MHHLKTLNALAFLAIAWVALPASAQSLIQRSSEPYTVNPDLKFEIARPTLAPVLVAPSPTPVSIPRIVFELRASDRSLKNAFLRWAEEHRQQVVWRLSGDIPLDANGPVSAVSLADAMTQAAAAIADKQEPFVIREYDNAIVVLPRWAARP